MKSKGIIIITVAAVFLFQIRFYLLADEILLKDGRKVAGKIQSVSADEIKYIPENEIKIKTISRSSAVRLKYNDGTVVNLPETDAGNFLAGDVRLSDSGAIIGLIYEDKTEPALFPFLFRIGLLMNKGETKVKIYDKDETRIADGDADFDQYMVKFSYEPVRTSFYFTTELGYFYRKVSVKDYSYSVENVNEGIDGFIPGIISEPDTGETISKESISSLAYTARIHSFFLDLKAGHNLVTGFKNVYLIFNPYVYTGLVEYRKTEFEFRLMDEREKFSKPFSFAFISAYGFGCEFGIFFPRLRSGIKIGYDRRYLPKFEISDKVKFKKVEYDNNLGVFTTRENTAKYTGVTANLVTVEFFFFI